MPWMTLRSTFLPVLLLASVATGCGSSEDTDACSDTDDCSTPPPPGATGAPQPSTTTPPTTTGFATTPTGPIAPTELDDLSAYLFQHVESPDHARAGLLELQQILDGNIPVDPTDFAVTISVLDAPELDTLALPVDTFAADQVTAALPHLDGASVLELGAAVTQSNQVCLMEQQIVWAERTFLTDDVCFADQSCDTLLTSTETRLETALEDNWLTLHGSWSWVRLTGPTGPVDALVGRSWTDQIHVADNGKTSWRQYFMLDALVPNPDDPAQTIRWRAWWSERDLPGASTDLFRSLMITDMDEALTLQQEWASTGTATSCTNDVNLPRP